MTLVYVAIGGALGSMARHYAAERIGTWTGSAAAGIFAVNVAGAFLIGLFLALAEERFDWPLQIRLFIATGFLGGFTTFSTLSWQTREFLELRDFVAAAVYLAGSIVVGMAAVYAGGATARVA